MDEKQITRLRAEYLNITIPEGYDMTVNKALNSTVRERNGWVTVTRRAALVLAAVACAFAVSVNALSAFALALQDLPVLGPIVRVLTFARFSASSEDQAYSVNVDVPEIQGLGDSALQNGLNERHLAEGQTLYTSFMQEIGGLANGELAHKALDAGYKVRVKTDTFLVVEHWVVVTMASGAESVSFDNVDLRNQVLVTLPGLFQDASYVETITANIKEQMQAQMADTDSGRMYFVDEFKQIKPDQSFYINAEHKLVIVFNEYEVAPGSMGVVEFVIPTEVIAGQLVGSGYIQ
jgi:hypothetical protein